MGRVYLQQGQFDQAYDEFLPVVEQLLERARRATRRPRSCSRSSRRTRSHVKTPGRSWSRSTACCRRTPPVAATYSQLTEAYINQGQFEQAAGVLEILVALEPQNAAAQDQARSSCESRGVGPRAARRAPRPAATPVSQVEEEFDLSAAEETDFRGRRASRRRRGPRRPRRRRRPRPRPPPRRRRAASARPRSRRSGPLTDEDREFIDEHLAEGKVFRKYGLVDKAADQFEADRRALPGPRRGAPGAARRLQGEGPAKAKAAEQCLALAEIHRLKGDAGAAAALEEEARELAPELFPRPRPPAPAVPAPRPGCRRARLGGRGGDPLRGRGGGPRTCSRRRKRPSTSARTRPTSPWTSGRSSRPSRRSCRPSVPRTSEASRRRAVLDEEPEGEIEGSRSRSDAAGPRSPAPPAPRTSPLAPPAAPPPPPAPPGRGSAPSPLPSRRRRGRRRLPLPADLQRVLRRGGGVHVAGLRRRRPGRPARDAGALPGTRGRGREGRRAGPRARGGARGGPLFRPGPSRKRRCPKRTSRFRRPFDEARSRWRTPGRAWPWRSSPLAEMEPPAEPSPSSEAESDLGGAKSFRPDRGGSRRPVEPEAPVSAGPGACPDLAQRRGAARRAGAPAGRLDLGAELGELFGAQSAVEEPRSRGRDVDRAGRRGPRRHLQGVQEGRRQAARQGGLRHPLQPRHRLQGDGPHRRGHRRVPARGEGREPPARVQQHARHLLHGEGHAEAGRQVVREGPEGARTAARRSTRACATTSRWPTKPRASPTRALGLFTELYGQDASFRDVAAKVRELRAARR